MTHHKGILCSLSGLVVARQDGLMTLIFLSYKPPVFICRQIQKVQERKKKLLSIPPFRDRCQNNFGIFLGFPSTCFSIKWKTKIISLVCNWFFSLSDLSFHINKLDPYQHQGQLFRPPQVWALYHLPSWMTTCVPESSRNRQSPQFPCRQRKVPTSLRYSAWKTNLATELYCLMIITVHSAGQS